ncbi:MAG: glutaredoxin family protein [Acidimicrobiia bacterium]
MRFLVRERCPLCDAARPRVERWARILRISVETVDVGTEPWLKEEFEHRVPVVLGRGGTVIVEGRFTTSALILGLIRSRLGRGR